MLSYWIRDRPRSWIIWGLSSSWFSSVQLFLPSRIRLLRSPQKGKRILRRNLCICRIVRLLLSGLITWGLCSLKKERKPPYLMNPKLLTSTKPKSSRNSTKNYKKTPILSYLKDTKRSRTKSLYPKLKSVTTSPSSRKAWLMFMRCWMRSCMKIWASISLSLLSRKILRLGSSHMRLSM